MNRPEWLVMAACGRRVERQAASSCRLSNLREFSTNSPRILLDSTLPRYYSSLRTLEANRCDILLFSSPSPIALQSILYGIH